LAEQWTENPRVGGSIPPLATPHRRNRQAWRLKELPESKLAILNHENAVCFIEIRARTRFEFQDLLIATAPVQSGEVFYVLGDRALSIKTLLFSIDTVVCLI
jgi:hypothetical protein